MTFKIGDKVIAERLGAGTIINIEGGFHLVTWENTYIHSYDHIINGFKYKNCYGMCDYELKLKQNLKQEIYAKVKYLGDKHAI